MRSGAVGPEYGWMRKSGFKVETTCDDDTYLLGAFAGLILSYTKEIGVLVEADVLQSDEAALSG